MAEEGADSPASQHINVKYHFLKEKVEEGVIKIKHVPTEHNTADLLTKSLRRVKHVKHTNTLMGNAV